MTALVAALLAVPVLYVGTLVVAGIVPRLRRARARAEIRRDVAHAVEFGQAMRALAPKRVRRG